MWTLIFWAGGGVFLLGMVCLWIALAAPNDWASQVFGRLDRPDEEACRRDRVRVGELGLFLAALGFGIMQAVRAFGY